MGYLFQEIFFRPILNLLIFLYNTIPGESLGLAIIFLTIIIKLILYPLSKKAIESQKSLQNLQPKINEIKEKYRDKKEEMGREMLNLYKDNKVHPFSSCLPLLIQLPFLIAVFRVLRKGINSETMQMTYSFIKHPEHVNNIFLGINLAQRSVVLALLAGAAQFWQVKMMSTKKPEIKSEGSKDEDMAALMNKQMTYFMPALTVIIGLSLPSGLALYWFATTVLTALQQIYIFKKG